MSFVISFRNTRSHQSCTVPNYNGKTKILKEHYCPASRRKPRSTERPLKLPRRRRSPLFHQNRLIIGASFVRRIALFAATRVFNRSGRNFHRAIAFPRVSEAIQNFFFPFHRPAYCRCRPTM